MDFAIDFTDYKFLEQVLEMELDENGLLNESYTIPFLLESPVGKRFLIDFFLFQESEKLLENQEEYEKEFEEMAKVDMSGKDTFFDGVGRLFSITSKVQEIYDKIKNRSAIYAYPIMAFVSATMAVKSRRDEVKRADMIRTITDEVKNDSKFKNEPPDVIYNEVSRRIADRMYGISNLQNELKSTNNFFSKSYKWVILQFKKFKAGVFSEKLLDLVDQAKELAIKNPLLTFGVVALMLGIIIFTIFKWNTVKRIFKVLLRIVISPVSFFMKGLKWLWSKITRAADEIEEEESNI